MRPLRLTLCLLLSLGACAGCRMTPPDAPAGATHRPSPPRHTPGPAALPQMDVTLHVPGPPLIIRAEVARTPAQRARGLMFREHLAEDAGMLFEMPGDDDWTFYMKNTLIPLDMLFLDADGVIVGIVEQARPLDERLLSVGRPSRFVLELPGGSARRRGVGVGTRASWPGGPKRTPPAP